MTLESNPTSNINHQTFVHTKSLLVAIVLVLIGNFANAQYDAERYPIIPKPYTLLPFNGDFNLNSETVIVTDNRFYRKEIEFFRQQVKKYYSVDLKYATKKVSGNFIYISEDSTDIPNEGYNLFINRNDINIYGGHAGIFYALQSLFQLFHFTTLNGNGIPQFTIPSCSIVDQPRFPWRGMHLDVSRHFFPKEDVKNYLRYMAMYKLNTFHWHLTDDQGWRIEIKKYPKLTSVGAWRNGTIIGHQNNPTGMDTTRYGGFYTQADIREIVKFADSLHITIVPEIEMPGHCLAMLAAYPELSCTGGPFQVANNWGVIEDVLCPSEKTFSFIDDVLKEVCALFPGKYIHIGGDECPKTRWKASSFCQDLMKTNNLKDEDQLQSWFTQHIVKMLQQKGKEAIGWDEILEGGLADGAAVMSWRGEDGGIAAAKAKHNVVMSPGGYCYFDHYQSQNANEPLAIGGFLPLEKVYSYNPVPASLSDDEKKYIMGVQANVWTEYIPTFAQVQYMIFPRMCALAEVAWDEPINMNFDFFVKRLIPQFQNWDNVKINYAKSLFEIKAKIERAKDGNGVLLSLSTLSPTGKIYYGFEMGDDSVGISYTQPILIDKQEELYAYLLDRNHPIFLGREYRQKFEINLATGKNISLRKNPSPSYSTGGSSTLADGIVGRTNPWVGSQWLGFWGDTLDAIIDLGKDTTISHVKIYTLDDKNSWIYSPENYRIQVSNDGINFTNAVRSAHQPEELSQYFLSENLMQTNTRYVRVIVFPYGKIPSGNPGEGNPAWLFVSEIEVK